MKHTAWNNTLITVTVAIILTMAGVFVIREVQAQVACGGTGDALCGGGLVCTGGRCNVPPPIWNAQLLGDQIIQIASFRVQHDSTVLGSLIVGGDLRTNSILSRLDIGSPDNIWIGDANDTVRIQGQLTVGRIVGGVFIPEAIRGNFVASDGTVCIANQILKRNAAGDAWRCAADDSGGGGIVQVGNVPWANLTNFPAACPDGQFVRAVGGALTCAAPPAGGPGGIQLELDPVFGDWQVNPNLAALTVRDDTLTATVLRITDTAQNPELQLRYGAGAADHWALYVDQPTQEIRLWRGDDRLRLTPTGDLTVSGNLTVGGTFNAPIALHGLPVPTDNVNCNSGRVLKISADGNAWICGEDVVGAVGGGGITDVNTTAGSGITVTAAGQNRTVGLIPCQNGEILQRNAQGQWVCAALPPPPPPPAFVETDPFYTPWYNSGSPTFAGTPIISGGLSVLGGGGLQVAGGGGFGGHNLDLTWRVTTPTLYVGNGASGTIIGAGAGQNAGDITTDGTLTVGGNVRASGCFGPTVVGATAAAVNGNLNGAAAPNDGYRGIDALCNAEFASSHQCETGEVMNSIHCGSIWTTAAKVALQPNIPAGVFTWIANGAPSLPTPTNDCYGWTQTGLVSGIQSQGIAWNFDVRGGGGFARACNLSARILCCR